MDFNEKQKFQINKILLFMQPLYFFQSILSPSE